jgi:hypothetical protein
VLYAEKVVYKNASTAMALSYLFPEKRFPDGISNPVLKGFFNAILHCDTAAEVCVTLNEAVQLAERKANRSLDAITISEYPSWANALASGVGGALAPRHFTKLATRRRTPRVAFDDAAVRHARKLGHKVIAHALAAALPLLIAIEPVAFAEDPIRPNSILTPGAVLSSDVLAICFAGYSKIVRHTSGQLKAFIYREYGIDRNSGHYEIDHLIPLSIGGADEAANLWPQSYGTHPWNATVKDELEDYLHREVCAGRIPMQRAQHEIATDWIAAYRRYVGEPKP